MVYFPLVSITLSQCLIEADSLVTSTVMRLISRRSDDKGEMLGYLEPMPILCDKICREISLACECLYKTLLQHIVS